MDNQLKKVTIIYLFLEIQAGKGHFARFVISGIGWCNINMSMYDLVGFFVIG